MTTDPPRSARDPRRSDDALVASGLDPDELVLVYIRRDAAEELGWAYVGHEPSQADERTRDALNAFRLYARWPRVDRRPVQPEHEIVVEIPRAQAEAMGFDGGQELVDAALAAMEAAL